MEEPFQSRVIGGTMPEPDPHMQGAERFPGLLASLDPLVGRDLASVTFVRDYFQLGFDGPTLTFVENPTIETGHSSAVFPDSEFRNLICDRINRIVSTISGDHDRIIIRFDDDSQIVVPLDDPLGQLLGREPIELFDFD